MLFRRNSTQAVYELVTRDGCHLCDEMAAVLDEVLPGYGLSWSPRDVDAEPELRARFTDAVPVLLRDGRPVAKVRLDRRSLIRIVEGRR
ncbi:MAG TPA: glutaredoxin family protein [Thermoanaerobaculia bacterium]|nr:glutaredoxin family protein [Thermoanaerobaculia bacterium]